MSAPEYVDILGCWLQNRIVSEVPYVVWISWHRNVQLRWGAPMKIFQFSHCKNIFAQWVAAAIFTIISFHSDL